ncbi:conserved hypothetical protein [Vibrio chagasii]|nr:conserved hypothetical protein [Vibrio chagasii]
MANQITTVQSLIEAQGISLIDNIGKRVQHNFAGTVHDFDFAGTLVFFSSGRIQINFCLEQGATPFSTLNIGTESEEKGDKEVIQTKFDTSDSFNIREHDRMLQALANDRGVKPYVIQMVQAEVARMIAQFIGEFEDSKAEEALHAYYIKRNS